MINKIILMAIFFISSISSMDQAEKIEYMKNGFKYAQQLGFIGNPEAKYEFMRTGGNFKEALAKQALTKINITVNQSPSIKESVKNSVQSAEPIQFPQNLSVTKNQVTEEDIEPSSDLQSRINEMEDRIKTLNEIISIYQKQVIETFEAQYKAMNKKYDSMNEKIAPALARVDQEANALENLIKDISPEKNREEREQLELLTKHLLTLQTISMHFGTGNIIVNCGNKAEKEPKNALQ